MVIGSILPKVDLSDERFEGTITWKESPDIAEARKIFSDEGFDATKQDQLLEECFKLVMANIFETCPEAAKKIIKAIK